MDAQDALKRALSGGSVLAPLMALACVLAVALVAVVQLLHVDDFLDVTAPLTAGFAKGLLLGYAVAMIVLVGGAATLPARWLSLPVNVAAGLAVPALSATLILGGQAWSFAWAMLTMAACWRVGSWFLAALRVPQLAASPIVAWLAGIGVLGIAILGIGRGGAITWWSAAVPIAFLGGLGLVSLSRQLAGGRLKTAWAAVTSSRLGAGAAALCILMVGLASVWTAAPELMYDALYYKAWLPSEWARTGAIEAQTLHPVLNFFGLAQLIAVPGHTAGAEAVGRYFQWLAYGSLPVVIWWAARRSPWAPAAAAATVLTPQLFWEGTTAYEDAILAVAAVALAVGVLRLLATGDQTPPVAAGLGLGVLVAACFNLKLHMAAPAVGLALGWLVCRGRDGSGRAIGGLSAGASVFVLPPLILRWVDTGNPLLPSYNNIFKSPYWPAVNWDFSFPRLADPGPLGPVSTIWTTIADTSSIDSYAPVGALGLLGVALAVALLTTWRRPGRGTRASMALWIGVLVGAAGWYLQFRNTRYMLPVGVMAILLIGISAEARVLGRRLQTMGLACILVVAVLLWPTSIAQFWNVPGRDIPWEAALGLVGDREYEERSTAAREVVAAFDSTAPPGSLAAGDVHQRAWLTEGRDLTPFWELDVRLQIDGVPTKPDAALARTREAGVGWVIAYSNGALTGRFPYLRAMLEKHGRVVWASPAATLYRLPPARR